MLEHVSRIKNSEVDRLVKMTFDNEEGLQLFAEIPTSVLSLM